MRDLWCSIFESVRLMKYCKSISFERNNRLTAYELCNQTMKGRGHGSQCRTYYRVRIVISFISYSIAMENTSYPRDLNSPKTNPKMDDLTQYCKKQCEKCLRPVSPDCDICGQGAEEEDRLTHDEAEERQSRSIFDVLWMNCTKRAFESQKRRLW